MSNTARIAATAANTLVKPLNVEEVFSTYLYDGGNGSGTNQAVEVVNGVDLSNEGGLTWFKRRDVGNGHALFDSSSSFDSYLSTEASTGSSSLSGHITPNTDGFTVGSSGFGITNNYNGTYVSFSFRKAPKFFTIVNYTGDGTTNRQISHDLGGTVGHITVKRTDTSAEWFNWHRTFSDNQLVAFSGTYAVGTYSNYLVTADSTTFTVGNNADVNANGGTYVAYLWGHNDGDGEFGPTGDQDIIKCGSYTGNGSTNGPEIDLGFEPQFVIVKNATAVSDWRIFDTMRGWHVANGSNDQLLSANLTSAESGGGFSAPNATGFKIDSTGSNYNTSGNTYIYIAIRRGTAVPESATDVFDVQTSTSANFVHTTGFDVDLAITGSQDGWARNAGVIDRLRGDGRSLETSNTTAESAGNAGVHEFDRSREYLNSSTSGNQVAWAWKRAPNYFDVVAYTGNSTAGRTVSHNLGVAPEMMWVKNRSSGVQHWRVYHSGLGATKSLDLNQSVAAYTSTINWNDTEPTSSVFSVGTSGATNDSGSEMIAYLFASLPGVSKVGSYTGTGAAQDIDCGFSSGARFVLIKRTDSTSSWFVFDSERGIVSGNDPYLYLNLTNAQVTSRDGVDPLSSGFSLTTDSTFNASGGSYIFYAIA